MANDEHVAMLKKGVDAWNAWREANPDIRPVLEDEVVRPAEAKFNELLARRTNELRVKNV
jgi:hypothetical protein